MITIRLPYNASDDFYQLLKNIRREYSSVVRYAYNRFKDGKSIYEVTKLCKQLASIKYLYPCMFLSSTNKAKAIFDRNKDNTCVIFGGKYDFQRWIKTKKKIWLKRWKQKRLLPFLVIGGKSFSGNRYFRLDIINENAITFKYNRYNHYKLQLPKLKRGIKNQLFVIEELMNNKQIPVTIEIDNKYISISFDEMSLRTESYDPIPDRIAAIDMNPNYIGFIVKDFNTGQIIDKEVISLKKLNDYDNSIKGLAKSDPKCKKITNIRHHMIYEISKLLINKCKHYKVETFVVEHLHTLTIDLKKGKRYNRLVNNQWCRTKFISNLHKRCNIIGLKFLQVYPQYSSTIGCIMYPDDVDSIGAAIELARRGYELSHWTKDSNRSVLFPDLDLRNLACRWKDKLGDKLQKIKSWKDLHREIKKSGMRYRLLLTDFIRRSDAVFNHHTIKTYIEVFVL